MTTPTMIRYAGEHLAPTRTTIGIRRLRVMAEQTDRSMAARIAAHTRWAKTVDRAAATAPARAALERKFEREADPDGVLPPDELSKRVENLRTAYFTRMALRSAQGRRRRRS